jgi:beta-lactamase superfamily II metal-dependent hydrolase
MAIRFAFAGYPTARLYQRGAETAPPTKLTAQRQLLWGDYVTVSGEVGEFYRARYRGDDFWMRKADAQTNRLLEIVFVDIGQGDGALLITPDDRKYVIDAGEGDNMHRFLRWRFGRFSKPVKFDAAILSHCDRDHYGGFEDLFAEPNLHFDAVYHNGLMERKAAKDTDILGSKTPSGDGLYITELIEDIAGLRAFLAQTAKWQGKVFPTMLHKGISAGKFTTFPRLDVSKQHLPGHGPGSKVEIQVLGPFAEQVNGKPALRWIGSPAASPAKTKNGHSVVLRLVIGQVTIFLGGDLNTESSRYLLEKHTGLSTAVRTSEEEDALMRAGRRVFGCDIAKACHHGSAEVFLPFMKAVNPVATIVSSGDEEPHAHPRADALGAIGRWGRGERPLIFSTELSRSSKESIKQPYLLRKKLAELAAAIVTATDTEKRDKAQLKFEQALAELDRSIATYGAINLRTDGTKVVLAYKLEERSKTEEWDIYTLEPQGNNGPLVYRG